MVHPVLRFSYRIVQVRASLFVPCEILRKPLGGENIFLKETEISSPSSRDPCSHLDLGTNRFLCSRPSLHVASASSPGRARGVLVPASPACSVIFPKPLSPSALPCANQTLPASPWLLHGREAESKREAVLGLRATGPFFLTVHHRFLEKCHTYQCVNKDPTRVISVSGGASRSFLVVALRVLPL